MTTDQESINDLLMPKSYIKTGEQLKEWRTRLGMTQAEFAKHLGVAHPTIQRNEKAVEISATLFRLILDLSDKAQLSRIKKA